MDGVVAGFVQGYKEMFFRDAYKDDPFTVTQFCMTVPNFFRMLPVLEKGRDLVNILSEDYKIVFLTTPMEGMVECRRDKIDWIKEHFGSHYDVIFSDDKAEYVTDEKSILIDDMAYNLEPWDEAGGTAIDIRVKNDKIIEKIDEVFNGTVESNKVKGQLASMEVNETPTEKQKESGNYKKGKIQFKGLDILIENPKGSIRWGFDERGQKWLQKMKSHYGYIVNDGGQETADGDKIDVFIGPKLNASRAFVVNQEKDGAFDEHKIMLGFNTIEEAEAAYLSNYQRGWDGLGSIKQTNTKRLREWLNEGNLNEPF